MADFRAWVVARVDAAVAAGELHPVPGDEVFLGFFALYFGGLVAGLRGDLDAAAQPVVLRPLLERLLSPKGGR